MIGFFGGSFDPIHTGHLHVATQLDALYPFKKLLFVPTSQNPHKKNSPIASNSQRYEMIHLLLQESQYTHWEVSDLELGTSKNSYTIDTLKTLHSTKTEIALIMGMDSFVDFPHWRNVSEILNQTHLIIVDRKENALSPDSPLNKLPYSYERVSNHRWKQLNSSQWIDYRIIDALPYSSTSLRSTISNNWKSNTMTHPPMGIPKCVWKFIKDNRLYSVTG